MREQQYVTNARGVCQKHDKAVKTDAAAACRRQAVFERADIVGVVIHGFIIAFGFQIGLSFESSRLILRIIQFGESVGSFASLSEARASGEISTG